MPPTLEMEMEMACNDWWDLIRAVAMFLHRARRGWFQPASSVCWSFHSFSSKFLFFSAASLHSFLLILWAVTFSFLHVTLTPNIRECTSQIDKAGPRNFFQASAWLFNWKFTVQGNNSQDQNVIKLLGHYAQRRHQTPLRDNSKARS